MPLPDPDDAPDLDAEFPLGDGTADVSAAMSCPHCGAEVEIALDPGGGAEQEYVEDCEVCCQPWQVTVRYGSDGSGEVQISALGG